MVGDLLHFYERMLVIREAEARLGKLFKDGKIPGFIHLSIGQEAIAVGVTSALRNDDTLASTHRGHGHSLAKGMSPTALFHEILGNAEGPCAGRGGSLHVADFSVGMLGANGIVGAAAPIALGSALAHKTLGTSCVAVAFFGDGAMAAGVLYETFNLAKLWSLPLLLVCENNGWSEFSPTRSQYAGDLQALASSFGIDYARVDGNDVEAVAAASAAAVEKLRGAAGPALIECLTRRAGGHYEGDPQAYRKEVAEKEALDPLERLLGRMSQEGIAQDRIAAVTSRVAGIIDAAEAAALRGTSPSFQAAQDSVYA